MPRFQHSVVPFNSRHSGMPHQAFIKQYFILHNIHYAK